MLGIQRQLILMQKKIVLLVTVKLFVLHVLQAQMFSLKMDPVYSLIITLMLKELLWSSKNILRIHST